MKSLIIRHLHIFTFLYILLFDDVINYSTSESEIKNTEMSDLQFQKKIIGRRTNGNKNNIYSSRRNYLISFYFISIIFALIDI